MARAECARLAGLLVVAMAMGASAQCDVEEGDMCLRVMGSSGKIMFCDGGEGQDEAACFTVRLQQFEEMTADGTGISSHTHQNLGTGGMALGTVGTYTFAACSTNTPLCGAGADGGDLRAMRIPITTNIGKQSVFATLDVSAYIMLTNGTITFAGQTLDVTQGTFKFDINVNNYKPCGSGTGYDTCTKGNTDMTGATFAFELVVAARGGKKLTQKGNTMTSDDGDMINFNSYRLQTVGSTSWSDEAADVALTTQGSAQVITYTFKVGSTITYDPVIGGSSESASLSSPTIVSLLVVVLAALCC